MKRMPIFRSSIQSWTFFATNSGLANLQAMLGMTRQVREAPFIINDLVALAIFRRTLETVGVMLADHPDGFDEAQLLQLAHQIATHGESQLRVRIEGERMGFADIVQRTYSDDGDGDGYLTARVGAEMPAAAAMTNTARSMAARCSRRLYNFLLSATANRVSRDLALEVIDAVSNRQRH